MICQVTIWYFLKLCGTLLVLVAAVAGQGQAAYNSAIKDLQPCRLHPTFCSQMTFGLINYYLVETTKGLFCIGVTYMDTRQNFDFGRYVCMVMGLSENLDIHSEEEQTKIIEILTYDKNRPTNITDDGRPHAEDYRVWLNTRGAPKKQNRFVNWANPNPTQNKSKCAAMDVGSGMWHMLSCQIYIYYLCRKDLVRFDVNAFVINKTEKVIEKVYLGAYQSSNSSQLRYGSPVTVECIGIVRDGNCLNLMQDRQKEFLIDESKLTFEIVYLGQPNATDNSTCKKYHKTTTKLDGTIENFPEGEQVRFVCKLQRCNKNYTACKPGDVCIHSDPIQLQYSISKPNVTLDCQENTCFVDSVVTVSCEALVGSSKHPGHITLKFLPKATSQNVRVPRELTSTENVKKNETLGMRIIASYRFKATSEMSLGKLTCIAFAKYGAESSETSLLLKLRNHPKPPDLDTNIPDSEFPHVKFNEELNITCRACFYGIDIYGVSTNGKYVSIPHKTLAVDIIDAKNASVLKLFRQLNVVEYYNKSVIERSACKRYEVLTITITVHGIIDHGRIVCFYTNGDEEYQPGKLIHPNQTTYSKRLHVYYYVAANSFGGLSDLSGEAKAAIIIMACIFGVTFTLIAGVRSAYWGDKSLGVCQVLPTSKLKRRERRSIGLKRKSFVNALLMKRRALAARRAKHKRWLQKQNWTWLQQQNSITTYTTEDLITESIEEGYDKELEMHVYHGGSVVYDPDIQGFETDLYGVLSGNSIITDLDAVLSGNSMVTDLDAAPGGSVV